MLSMQKQGVHWRLIRQGMELSNVGLCCRMVPAVVVDGLELAGSASKPKRAIHPRVSRRLHGRIHTIVGEVVRPEHLLLLHHAAVFAFRHTSQPQLIIVSLHTRCHYWVLQ